MFNIPVILLKNLVILPNQEIKLELNNVISGKAINEAEYNFKGEILVIAPIDALEEDPSVDDLPKVGVIARIKNKINNVQISMTDRNLYKTLLQYETSYMDGVDLEYLGDGGNKQSKEFYVNFIAMVLEAKKRNLPLNYEKLIRNIEYIWANYY